MLFNKEFQNTLKGKKLSAKTLSKHQPGVRYGRNVGIIRRVTFKKTIINMLRALMKKKKVDSMHKHG